MNKHSNISHVKYFDSIYRQNKYNRHCLLGNNTDSYDISRKWVILAYSQQANST